MTMHRIGPLRKSLLVVLAIACLIWVWFAFFRVDGERQNTYRINRLKRMRVHSWLAEAKTMADEQGNTWFVSVQSTFDRRNSEVSIKSISLVSAGRHLREGTLDLNLSVLKNAEAMEVLHIENAKLTELESLPQSLRYLSLHGCHIDSPELISRLFRLQSLTLSFTKVSDLKWARSLNRLQTLDVSSTRISSLAGIPSEIQRLDISFSLVDTLQPLARSRSLLSLQANRCPISQLHPIQTHVMLKELQICETNVYDISALARLKQLEELWISDTPVADLSTLAQTPRLERLNSWGCERINWDTLPRLPQLRRLRYPTDIDENDLADRLPNCRLLPGRVQRSLTDRVLLIN